MDYDFYRLDSRSFEHMVQALLRKIFGLGMITFGEGRDGGREAVFQGKYEVPLAVDRVWDGCWIAQAKFKSRSQEKESDFNWVRKQFAAEMKKFKQRKGQTVIPHNYLFFTNAVLTGVAQVGGRDKIEKLKSEYAGLVPNIIIYGLDDLKNFLENNREVATAYASFILPGDILMALFTMLEDLHKTQFDKKKDDYHDIIKRFLHKEFLEDLYPKLGQGGKKSDDVIKLEQVFIDLHANEKGLLPEDRSEKKFVEMCTQVGDSILNPDQAGNRFVLLGNFGRGKSTLGQFLCQVYRAFFLRDLTAGRPIEEVDKFIDKYCSYKKEPVRCRRLPFKIDLIDYAVWLAESGGKDSTSILAYIRHHLKERADSGGDITLNDLREIFKSLSLVFVFDGLDEVGVSWNREAVIKQINDFTDIELRHLGSDALIIVTTRPQGYIDEFERQKYRHLTITELPGDDCEKYLKLLLANLEPEEKRRRRHLDVLKRALGDPVISELMKTPLQATIMAVLVKSGGEPPKDRYNLFEKYYQTILDRESQKGTLRRLNGLPDKYYLDIHSQFGFESQRLSGAADLPTAGHMGRIFDELIRGYLRDCGCDRVDELAGDIRYNITHRLLFIVEDREQSVKFSIRALQEYFSAIYYFNCKDKFFPDRLRQIGRSAYWRNTLLFGAGYTCNARDYRIDSLCTLCSDLNGAGLDPGKITVARVAWLGSWLALDILKEGIFRNFRKFENKFAECLEPLFRMAPGAHHSALAGLSPAIRERYLSKFIKEYLSKKEFKDQMAAWVVTASLIHYGHHEAIKIADKHWPTGDNEIFLLNHLNRLKLSKNDWFIDKFLAALTEDSAHEFQNILSYEQLFDLGLINLITSRISTLDDRVKAILAEQLFLNILAYEKQLLYFLELESVVEFYFEFFGVKPLELREKEIMLTDYYGINTKYLLVERGNLKSINTIRCLKERFRDLKIKHLEYMMGAILEPSSETVKRFLTELMTKSDKTFQKIKGFCLGLNLFPQIFESLENKADIKKYSEYEIDCSVSDIGKLGQEVNKKNVGKLLKRYRGRTFMSPIDIEAILGFYRNFYKKYIDVVDEESRKYIHNELLRFLSWSGLNFPEIVLAFSKQQDFADDLVSAILETRNLEEKPHYVRSDQYLLMVGFLSSRRIVELIQKEEGDIFDGIDIGVTYGRFVIFDKDSVGEIFNKTVDIVNALHLQNIESAVIRLLLYVVIWKVKDIGGVRVGRLDFENMYKMDYGDPVNDISRWLLCMLDPDLDEGKSQRIMAGLRRLKDEGSVYTIVDYVILFFEECRLQKDTQIEMFLHIYQWIPRELKYLQTLSRYELYLKETGESKNTHLNDPEIIQKLHLKPVVV